jgi:hypothetical protein
MKDRDLYSIEEARERLGEIFAQHPLRDASQGRDRERDPGLPSLHCSRCNCEVHQVSDYDEQPRHGLDAQSEGCSAIPFPSSPHVCESASSRRRHLALQSHRTNGV